MAIKLSIIVVSVAIGGYFVFQNYVNSQTVEKTTGSIVESVNNSFQHISTETSKQASSNTIQRNTVTATPNRILTEDNYYAHLVPLSVQVTDKGRYNLINLTVKIEMQNLPFEATVFFRDLYTTLQDENSKSYEPDKAECVLNEFVQINGKVADTATYNVCYSVDKSSKKFTVFYTEPLLNYHATKVGHLVLDGNFFKYYEANRNPQPTKIGTIVLAK